MRPAHKYLKPPVVQLALILLLGLLAYSNTFDVPFQFDDTVIVAKNPDIKDPVNIPGFFTGGGGMFSSRPLLHATTALNYYFGGLNVWGYHAVNVALHLINCVLLYLLVAMTGRHLRFDENNWRTAAALSALLFVVHPLQTEAVTYITSRSMLFATAFYMLGMIFFLKAATIPRKRVLYGAGLFVVSMFGMASRENFSTFPLMLFAYDVFVVSGFRVTEALRRHYKLYVPVLLAFGYFIFIVLSNTYDRGADYPGIGVKPYDYVISQFRVHWTYLRLLALPVGQNADFDYPIATSIFGAYTLLAFAGYVGLWAGAKEMARKMPVVSFGVLWFLIALVPISFAVSLMNLRLGNVIFEHRAYLPSVGVITAFVWGMVILTDGRAARKAAVAAVVVMAVVFASATHVRNRVWQSDVSFWEDVVAKSPGKDRGHYNLGLAYYNRGKTSEAIEQLEAAAKYAPGASSAHNLGIIIKDASHFKLGVIYQEQGSIDKAIENYGMAARINPGHVQAHKNLGLLYRQKGQADKAIEHYVAAMRFDPENAELHNNIGNAYDIAGQAGKAIEHYREAVRLKPDFALAHFNLGISYYNQGQPGRALAEFKRALEIRPDFEQARQAVEQLK